MSEPSKSSRTSMTKLREKLGKFKESFRRSSKQQEPMSESAVTTRASTVGQEASIDELKEEEDSILPEVASMSSEIFSKIGNSQADTDAITQKPEVASVVEVNTTDSVMSREEASPSAQEASARSLGSGSPSATMTLPTAGEFDERSELVEVADAPRELEKHVTFSRQSPKAVEAPVVAISEVMPAAVQATSEIEPADPPTPTKPTTAEKTVAPLPDLSIDTKDAHDGKKRPPCGIIMTAVGAAVAVALVVIRARK